MPFNGSGTFFRLHNFENDRTAQVPVTSVRVDAEFQGIADALSMCLTRDGQSSPSGPISFPSGIFLSDGAVGAPSLAFINDIDLGIFRDGANTLAIAGGSGRIANFSPAEVRLAVPKLTVTKDQNSAILFDLKNLDVTSPAAAARMDMQAGTVTGTLAINHDNGTGLVGAMTIGTTNAFPLLLQANGIRALDVWGTHMWARIPIRAVSVADPAIPFFTFDGDFNTGLYRSGVHTIGFTIDGVLTYSMGPDGFVSGQQIRAGFGSQAAPAYSFISDTNTGLRRSAAGTTQFVGSGVALADFALANITLYKQLLASFGTALLPGISFDGDPDTGLFRSGSNTINIVLGGSSPISLSPTTMSIALQIQATDGTLASPAYSFLNDTASGLRRSAAGTTQMVAAGAAVADFAPTGLILSKQLLASFGAPTLPGISFNGDPDTGFFRSAPDTINVVLGATSQYVFSPTAFAVGSQIQSQDGAVGGPAYSFLSATNTGMYRDNGDGSLRFAVAGVASAVFGTVFTVLSKPILIGNGTAAAPGLAFIGGSTSGFYYSAGPDTVGIAAGGVAAATFTAAAAFHPFGTPTVPGISFLGDPNTGFSCPSGVDNINVVCGGVTTLIFSGAGLALKDGPSDAFPSLSFLTDINTGMWRPGNDILAVVAGGVRAQTIEGTSTAFGGKINLPTFGNTVPADGDIWSNGTNVLYRSAGVTYVLTKV